MMTGWIISGPQCDVIVRCGCIWSSDNTTQPVVSCRSHTAPSGRAADTGQETTREGEPE